MKQNVSYLGLGLSVLGLLVQVYAFLDTTRMYLFSYWLYVGVVCSIAGLCLYSRAPGKSMLWGGVGIVPFIGAVAGLLALAPRGLGLAVLGLVLQACEWYSIGLVRIPFSMTMLVSSGIAAVGLACYAYERGRPLAWGLLGLLLVLGPARVLTTLPGPGSEGSSRVLSLKARVAHGLLIPPAVVLSLHVCLLNVGRVEVAAVSPDRTQRVQLGVFPNALDYNYSLRMQRLGALGIAWNEPIYGSLDEPFGARRVVWAKDGSRFVVMGPRDEWKRSRPLRSGEKVYLT